jgi:hypothetical protein
MRTLVASKSVGVGEEHPTEVISKGEFLYGVQVEVSTGTLRSPR